MKNEDVNINLWKHRVLISDKRLIHIRHSKKCKKECNELEKIIDYLQAEDFVGADYLLTETYDDFLE